MVSISAFQADDEGSIPFFGSITVLRMFRLRSRLKFAKRFNALEKTCIDVYGVREHIGTYSCRMMPKGESPLLHIE